MGWKGWRWSTLLATVLCVQAVGCSSDEPAPTGPPDGEEAPSGPPEAQVPVPPVPEEQTPPAPQEPPPGDPAPTPACEGLLPAQLGPSRNIVLEANASEADCGPGAGDGAGFLALRNSGPLGATAWDVVSGEGIATGNLVTGGDMSVGPMPQPQGFQVLKSSPGGSTLYAYSSEGAFVNSQPLTNSYNEPSSLAAHPQGGALVAVWVRRPDNLQALTYRFFDAAAVPLGPTTELGTWPLDGNRFILAGVDTQGRALLLWPEPGESTWSGQWVSREGGPLTQPFTFPAPGASTSFWRLAPLAGGGLALRGDTQWVARFASGEAAVQPAPAWLTHHPGSELVLIRGQQANALIRMPTMSTAGCQESLLVFAGDGTACGELLFPPDGSTCFQRQLGVGRDGTVIQQIDVSAQATPQCSWRWWPGLLR
jgi:hypothetical protein